MPTPESMRLLLLLPVLATACAKGGDEERPQSEVAIAASHHLYGFRTLAGFGSFPVAPTVVATDRGVLNTFEDSTYTITRPTGTSGADTYALAANGDLTLYVTGSGYEPSVLFLGGYALTETDADLFFTDRVATNSSPRIGLFVATEVISAVRELEGGWHLASMHVVFDQAILSPDNVARACWGGVSIAGGDPGTARAISGTGQQGNAAVTFGGSIQYLLANNIGDGTCNLTVDYTVGSQAADSRVFYAACGEEVVLGLDADESDGEAGLLFMLRKFDTATAPADPASVAGTYLVGGYTTFVNPSDPGSDAFHGTVTLTAQGGFRLEAIGNQGIDFLYTGTATMAQDGSMSIAIAGTNETWHAAVDRDYKTLVFVDDFQETRSSGAIELNLGFGVREKPTTGSATLAGEVAPTDER